MHASLELYANLANITGPQAYESTHTHTHTFRPQSPTHIPSDNNGKHFAKCKRPRRTVTGRGRLSFAFKVLPYGQQRYVLLPQSVQPYEVSSKKGFFFMEKCFKKSSNIVQCLYLRDTNKEQ